MTSTSWQSGALGARRPPEWPAARRGRRATFAAATASRRPLPGVALAALLVALLACCAGARAKSIESASGAANLATAAASATHDKLPAGAKAASVEPLNANSTSSIASPASSASLASLASEAEEEAEEAGEDDATGAGPADCADAACRGVLAGQPEEARGRSDNARLVALQAALQERIRRQMAAATRNGLELFERLTLSGGCTASLMNLMGALGELKAYAFKFLDASAKIPSGMMYGLLSDFGDFDECLAIRSDARVAPRDEVEEGTYSGKYCLASLKLNYHVQLTAAETAAGAPPAGIYADGVLWDALIRQYWISNSTKGFQVGLCVPSRCSADDLEQIFSLMAAEHNFSGRLTNCQDSNDRARQQTPDWLQQLIIMLFASLLALSLLAGLLERYARLFKRRHRAHLAFQLLLCFSIRRNWRHFLGEPARSGQQAAPAPLQRGDALHSLHSNSTQATQAASDRQSSSGAESGAETPSFGGASLGSFSPARLTPSSQQPLSVQVEPLQEDKARELQEAGEEEASHGKPLLAHLAGLKLLVIVWITVGHSFLYPSANNYQYYRSIINMNITRDSVWFAATNFTLGIDTLLYMLGLVFALKVQSGPEASKAAKQGQARDIAALLGRKVLRFGPTYLALIALAIVLPLAGDGPMWPEMVERRLGAACRQNWWANLLMVNNFMSEHSTCLPSSWFLSAVMQCLLVGALLMLVQRKWSQKLAIALTLALIAISSLMSFALAYQLQLRAPAIRMDESFVLEIDDQIYRLYTSTFSNLGPFLVGLLGGLLLNRWQLKRQRHSDNGARLSPRAKQQQRPKERAFELVCQLNVALAVGLVAVSVLSSVFHQHYTRLWASIYWSCHRLGWALVSGYLIHQCATGRFKLLRDLLALASLVPLSKLVFAAYLAYPLFIHLHSGLVRDGLHVSLYNMLNIYTTRLAMTFVAALALHLLVELPLNSLENLLLQPPPQPPRGGAPSDLRRAQALEAASDARRASTGKLQQPLLAVAPIRPIELDRKLLEVGGVEAGREELKARGLDDNEIRETSDLS